VSARRRIWCPLLSAYAVRRAVSSPSQRCLDTLTPYVAAAGLTVVPDHGLSERGAEVAGGAAERCLAALLDGSDASVLCTHRPVLPRLLEVVEARCGPALGPSPPSSGSSR
jgi:8-oxo-dGTP diphosphatase